ncbi:MAG: hypothetical protein ACSHX9_12760 [Luteolibacter sp.]
MKPIHFLPPAVALAVTGFLIGGQRKEIGKLEVQSEMLSREVAKAKSRPFSTQEDSRPDRSNIPNGEKEPIDWKELATVAEEMNISGSVSDMRKMMSFQRRMLEMDKEELIAALDEIESLDLTDTQRTALIGMILDPLSNKDPELALTRFSDRLNDSNGVMSWRLARALGNWAGKDGTAAAAWLDKQIADGVFVSKSLDGKNQVLKSYEGHLFASMLGDHSDIAEERIATMSKDERRSVLSHGINQLKEENQEAFAEITRRNLDEVIARDILVEKARNIAMMSDLEDVDGYIDRISATPAERKGIAENAASSFVQGKSYQGKVTAKDIDEMRDWLGERSPESLGSTTGKTLGQMANENNLGFEESATLALRYHGESGDDELLVSFLENSVNNQNKDQARAIAEKILDPEIRKQELADLE